MLRPADLEWQDNGLYGLTAPVHIGESDYMIHMRAYGRNVAVHLIGFGVPLSRRYADSTDCVVELPTTKRIALSGSNTTLGKLIGTCDIGETGKLDSLVVTALREAEECAARTARFREEERTGPALLRKYVGLASESA